MQNTLDYKFILLFLILYFNFNNFILDERIGNLVFVTSSPDEIVSLKSQVTLIVRGMYSNPPQHGARIVTMVLKDKHLYDQWRECIRTMSNRIIEMRKALHNELVRQGTAGNWDHILSQIGMFSYTGLSGKNKIYFI